MTMEGPTKTVNFQISHIKVNCIISSKSFSLPQHIYQYIKLVRIL